jgi:hypothetical protein
MPGIRGFVGNSRGSRRVEGISEGGKNLTCYAHGDYDPFHITANASICELLSSHYLPKL